MPQCRKLPDKASAKSRKAASKVLSQRARVACADLLPTLQVWMQAGMTQQVIADNLDTEGHTTRSGKPWNQVQTMRVLTRAARQ